MKGEIPAQRIKIIDHPVVMDGQHLLEVPHEICVFRADPPSQQRAFVKTVDIDHLEQLTHSVEFI